MYQLKGKPSLKFEENNKLTSLFLVAVALVLVDQEFPDVSIDNLKSLFLQLIAAGPPGSSRHAISLIPFPSFVPSRTFLNTGSPCTYTRMHELQGESFSVAQRVFAEFPKMVNYSSRQALSGTGPVEIFLGLDLCRVLFPGALTKLHKAEK